MRTVKHLTVIELTVPYELNIENAHSRKTNKYAALISDINSNGIKTNFIALEIGSRGYISPENMKNLKEIFELRANNDVKFKDFKNSVSKIAIVSSFVIFNARNDKSWDNYPTLIYS